MFYTNRFDNFKTSVLNKFGGYIPFRDFINHTNSFNYFLINTNLIFLEKSTCKLLITVRPGILKNLSLSSI
ncbi:hypothetical protein E5P55_00515 [Candidatus Pinguicoccus supinus]|uniref:Uncharacterized protein n=1 Tax=Candidatus Pinguicoccus supinus TaxID=2529394 RepID=A0A7T0BRI5_9BACT|nr:hypothetical protein E5P55_00515 [Candidatus Pinguicoccus supinus]